ncbi:MAG: CDP-alcohol phosphatidyltransferase family protein [Firmicutes bacterium]|nr:CDP-alcohol phosphatidyltransferase family protein [Bacillota bacterium]
MKKSDVLNIPNLLSLLRILMIPAFVILFFKGGHYLYWAAGVLIASGLTDMLDGVIARHFHMITPLGQMLDPVADKLTQGTIGVCMMIAYIKQPAIVALFVCFFLKEFAMGLGGLILLLKKKRPVPAQWYGKAATFAFYISIIIVVFSKAIFEYDKLWIVWVFVGLTAVLMLYAFVRYAGIFVQIMKGTYVYNTAAAQGNTADV